MNSRILLVDDEPSILRSYSRLLTQAGFVVETASNGSVALDRLAAASFDVVVTDLLMPQMSGSELVRHIRLKDKTLPIVVMTAAPSLESAIQAVDNAATAYLLKPVEAEQLVAVIQRAVDRVSAPPPPVESHEPIENIVAGSILHFQPIVWVGENLLVAYEALLRPQSKTIKNPLDLLRRAEDSGRLELLGRHVRKTAAAHFGSLPAGALMFINVHPADLLDSDLYDVESALSPFAPRVVFELTERAALEDVPELTERVQQLRKLGYRIAIDDLGAGYSSLSSLVTLEPEFVKLDMGLVRDIDKNKRKHRLVEALGVLADSLEVRVVAEGVETAAERDTLFMLRISLMQGWFFARPAFPFPAVAPEKMSIE